MSRLTPEEQERVERVRKEKFCRPIPSLSLPEEIYEQIAILPPSELENYRVVEKNEKMQLERIEALNGGGIESIMRDEAVFRSAREESEAHKRDELKSKCFPPPSLSPEEQIKMLRQMGFEVPEARVVKR